MQLHSLRIIHVVIVLLIGVALLGPIALAQSIKVEGLIKARNGDTLTLQTADSASLVVLLTDNTEVGQVQGVFKARRKEMSMAALIPGLEVKIEGTYNDQSQLVAKSVSFKGNDLEQAQKIEAGMHETRVQAQQNKAELEKHNVALQEQQQQIAANKASIDAAVERSGQLDDDYILDEVTVYFGNGQVKVDPSYRPKLLALAEKAKTINGYVIEVKGHASSVGSVTLNQQLSEDRANERSEEHTSELQSRLHLVCRLLLEKKKHYSTVRSVSPTVPPSGTRRSRIT